MHPENQGLFPQWAADAALRSYTDLTVFAELDPAALDAEQAPHSKPAPRWISVVFLDGSEADEVLDLIRREGTDAAIDHLAGFADYMLTDGLITFTHTEIDPAYEGQGLGSQLVRAALDDVRTTGERTVLPLCPFVKAWIQRHPDYMDLLYGQQS